jgi:hypothetical protein
MFYVGGNTIQLYKGRRVAECGHCRVDLSRGTLKQQMFQHLLTGLRQEQDGDPLLAGNDACAAQ